MFGKSSNSRISSIACGDREFGSEAGCAAAGVARPEAAAGAPFVVLGAAAAWNPLTLVLVAGFAAVAALAAALVGAGGTAAFAVGAA